jgi:hypothetical protein
MGIRVKVSFAGLADAKKRLFAKLAEEQTHRLIEYAPLLLKKAYKQSLFTNRTYNLADSYVWAVYYNGVLKDSGYLYVSKVAEEPSFYHGDEVNGRAMAEAFVNSYTPQTYMGWDLVLAATTPYAKWLEKWNFYVLSSIYDEIVEDFGGKAKITTFNI